MTLKAKPTGAELQSVEQLFGVGTASVPKYSSAFLFKQAAQDD